MPAPSKNKSQHSIKHAIIDKTNSRLVATVAVATFLIVFSLLASRSLFSQSLYQQRVISEKEAALKTLKENKAAADELRATYESFAGEAVNSIGGNPDGDGPRDGENPIIVLDALPSEYDFPGLSSSVEKLLVEGGFLIESIGGAEQSVSGESGDVSNESVDVVDIQYPIQVIVPPENATSLLLSLERSIRPFYVDSIDIIREETGLTMDIRMRTFYQPAVGVKVTTETIQ